MPIRLLCLLLLVSCSLEPPVAPPEEEPPLFLPGEYGGDPLPGTEHLYNLQYSRDGSRIALIRHRTPGSQTDPTKQLWIVKADGTDPELIAVNVGTADWSPDDRTLAVTVNYGFEGYAYTIDLETRQVRQWTGAEGMRLDRPIVSYPNWFGDGKRLLVSVYAKGYKQTFERGTYVIDTETGETIGPLLELFDGTALGNYDSVIIGTKYLEEAGGPLDGNRARYDVESGAWEYITSLPPDSIYAIDGIDPSPTSNLVAYGLDIENATQLFLMNNDGSGKRQVTRLGGSNPRFSYDGHRVLFQRDVHKGPGARYVPFVLDVETETVAPLWPHLPDSLPTFPPLATQRLNTP